MYPVSVLSTYHKSGEYWYFSDIELWQFGQGDQPSIAGMNFSANNVSVLTDVLPQK